MNNKKGKVFIKMALILGILAITSCSNQLTAKGETDYIIHDHSKNVNDEKNIPSIYKNLKDINGGKVLVFHFNLNSSQPHPNNTNNRNNAKNTIVSDHSLKTDTHQLAIERLPHRN